MASPSSHSSEERQQTPEEVFHKAIFEIVNESGHRLKRATSEARDLCYSILREDVDRELLTQVASHWLDNFGRDPIKERLR